MSQPQYLSVIAPNKSPNDEREYKAVELPNKLKVVLVSDPTVEKSACAMSVGVGSMCDTDRSLGMAHFLEHMLFMGSESFPEFNQYSSFIVNNGGYDNAFTQMEETNYYFEVANNGFPEGVKRLAEFFRKALLNPECVEKERQAVHEEFKLWTADDNCRKWQIIHSLAKGPYSRFTLGNQDTLNHPYILEDLKKYYDEAYSANIINAVLISNLSIAQQEELLMPLRRIENKNYQQAKYEFPFPKESLGKMIKMESIKDEYVMEFIWVLDDLKSKYRNHIDEYLVYVLSHESQGSLAALLESQGLVAQLMGYKHHDMNFTVIAIELLLTQTGTYSYKKIYQIVMQYVAALRPEEFIYSDIKLRNSLKWQFLEKMKSSDYSSKLASNLHFLPAEHILDYKNLFDDFDANLIGSYLAKLNEDNLIVVLSSINPIKGSVVEPYFGAKYKVEPLLKFKKDHNIKFDFLKSNKFLPVGISMQPESYPEPRKLKSNVTLLKRNTICKGGIALNVYSPHDKVFLEVFQEWCNMMLKESTYDAAMLDSTMDFDFGKGIWISVFAYNQVALKLMGIIGHEIHQLVNNKKKAEIFFETVRDRMMQDYENYYLNDGNDVATDELCRILNCKNEITVLETFKTLGKFTFKRFAEKVADFWKNVQLEWIAVGNFSEAEIMETVSAFEKGINNDIGAVRLEPCLKLTDNLINVSKIPSSDIANSASIIYFQFDRNNFRNKIMVELLLIFIKEPFFDDLRTTKQLGYIASSDTNLHSGIIGMKFLVVSSTADAHSIRQQMLTFVLKHFATLKDATPEKLESMKHGVWVKQCEPLKSLEQEFEFIVHQIVGRTYEFNRKDKAAVQAQLDSITLDHLVTAVEKLLRYHVSVEVVSQGHMTEFTKHGVKEMNFDEIKKLSQFHPDYESPATHLI